MTESVSFNEIVNKARENFFNLLKKTWEDTQRNLRKYSDEDIRCSFFTILSETNLWLLIHFDVFQEMLNENDTKINRYMTLNPQSRIQYLAQHDTINRIGYATKTMFDVEDFIKELAKGLNKPAKGKYYEFTKKFLKDLDIYSEQKYKILNAPYQIRNSLHNNGYAYHNFDISLRGVLYKFVKGQQITFTGWNNLYIFFDELTDLLLEVIKNPKIEEISLIPSTSIPEPKSL